MICLTCEYYSGTAAIRQGRVHSKARSPLLLKGREEAMALSPQLWYDSFRRFPIRGGLGKTGQADETGESGCRDPDRGSGEMTYVMSDIHGRIRPYHRMLKQIGFCEDDTLYILGDVIDRNPSGIPILKEIMDTPNIRLLLGNHEYMMRDFLDTDQQDDLDAWAQKMDRWCNRNGGWVTYHAFLRESQRAQDRILAFLHRLPVNIEISVGGRRILLVHASPTFLYSESRPGMKDETEFAVWNRLAPGSGLDFPQDLMICGHTPTILLSGIFPMEILQDGRIIWIDCGCAYGTGRGGRLSCLRLETEERFYESAG